MTDLAEVAASVAKALGLSPCYAGGWLTNEGAVNPIEEYFLRGDGSNLTDPYWIWRCVEWLLAEGYSVAFDTSCMPTGGGRGSCFRMALGPQTKRVDMMLDGPIAEFPARAIHELMKERK